MGEQGQWGQEDRDEKVQEHLLNKQEVMENDIKNTSKMVDLVCWLAISLLLNISLVCCIVNFFSPEVASSGG